MPVGAKDVAVQRRIAYKEGRAQVELFLLRQAPDSCRGLVFFLSSAMARLEGGKGAFAIGGRTAYQTCRALPSPAVTVITEGCSCCEHPADGVAKGVSTSDTLSKQGTPPLDGLRQPIQALENVKSNFLS